MKIIYFGDNGAGAMGIIHRHIKKIIDKKYPEIQFDLVNWDLKESYQIFFNQKSWKNYDVILIDPYMAKICPSGWTFDPEDHESFKSKLVPVYHTEVDIPGEHFNHGWFGDWFTTPVCGINPYIVSQIKGRGLDSQLLPIGVCREKFKPFKEVKKIKKIGFVGHCPNPDWILIKRPELFNEICEHAGVEPVMLNGRKHGRKMYEDVDAIICTSIVEGLPTYFAEVVACKIPFISTNVGIVREYSKVRTFETIDQAVEIINHLNKSDDNIKDYVNNLYGEMFPDRDWENILDKYWIPYFKELVNKNMQ